MNEDADLPEHFNWHDEPSFWYHEEDLPRRPRRARDAVFGAGRLATAAELDRFTSFDPTDRHALRMNTVGLLVEPDDRGRTLRALPPSDLYWPREYREKHMLAVGLTGVGKTQKLILPQLAEDVRQPGRAVIALDAKGGVLFEFIRHLAAIHRPGQQVQQVNLKRPDRNTIGWNPARVIRSKKDALEIAHAVCSNVESGLPPKDPFWLNSSITLLADVLLAMGQIDPAHASLARAKDLIDAFPHGLAAFVHGHDSAFPAIERVLESPNQNPSSSIIADLAMRLMLFGDEGIVQCVCQENELDLKRLINDAGLLVLEVCESDATELTPLTNLFITRMFSTLMNMADARVDRRLPGPTSITLDELGSACGRIQDFEKRLATLRSRGVSLIGAVQTLSQLHDIYGHSATAIIGNFNTKLYFGGGLGVPDARFASEESGTMTAEFVQVSKISTGKHSTTSRTVTPVSRPVLLPEEIARPVEHPLFGPPVTILTPTLPPFMAYLTPAHQIPGVREALPASSVFEVSSWSNLDEDTSTEMSADERVIQLSKAHLGWRKLPETDLHWWSELEARYRTEHGSFARLLQGLVELLPLYRQVTGREDGLLQEFRSESPNSGVTNVEGNIAFLMWRLTQRLETKQNSRTE